MPPEQVITDYVETLDSQGLSPEDFELRSWFQGVLALRRYVREGIVDPRFPDFIQGFINRFQAQQQAVQAARAVPETPAPPMRTGTLYVPTERGSRLASLMQRRPDLTPNSFDIRQNDVFALFQIIENPGMAEEDLDVNNARGAIISLRQRGLIEAV